MGIPSSIPLGPEVLQFEEVSLVAGLVEDEVTV
jgi:hypothetical protein